MKLSIIIPVYCVEATLDRCLQSVAGQDFADFEVILVDDGSPDGCPQKCDLWASRDSRFTVVHQPNGGLSDARNTGLERAVGDFVTFIDSDDYIAPGTLGQLMPLTANADLIEYPVWQHYGSPRQQLLSLADTTYTDTADYWLQTQAYRHTYAWNKLYRRTLFGNVRFPKGKVFEDAYTLPLLLRQSPRITTTTRGLYYYCDNPRGITATATGIELRMLLEAHLAAAMPIDDDYYMHLVNIQMDVCRLTGDTPRLPMRRVKPAGDMKQVLKAITLNLIGIRNLCSISKTIHRLRPW